MIGKYKNYKSLPCEAGPISDGLSHLDSLVIVL